MPWGRIDRSKAYFLFFQLNIDLQTSKTLRNYLVALAEGGVGELTLVITSSGGLVMPALELYGLIRSLPLKVTTHAQTLVASAANVLYLAGDNRSTDANTRFVFHPTQTPISGTFNTPQFADQMEYLNVSAEIMDGIYRARTKLPEDEIKRFQKETVLYNAAKAVDLAIAERLGELSIPGGGKAKFVFMD